MTTRRFPNRSFGIELEITGIGQRRVHEVLNNAGFRTYGGFGSRYDRWRVKGDCSIRGLGAEVVSPILCGYPGLREVETVCKLLSDAGASANSSCGMHVHVEAKDFKYDDVGKIIETYSKFEDEIDSLVYPRRRQAENSFCLPAALNSFRSTAVLQQAVDAGPADCQHIGASYWDMRRGQCVRITESSSDVERRTAAPYCYQCATHREVREALAMAQSPTWAGWRSAIWGNKYNKVNIASLRGLGTIEFRQHQGSCNPKIATNWIRFVVNLTEAVKSGVEMETPFDGLSLATRRFYEKRKQIASRHFNAWC